ALRDPAAAPLAAWRLLDLETSALRDQRRLDEALGRNHEAWNLAPPAAHGRLLVSRATVLAEMGRHQDAVDALDKAEPLLDRRVEPRLVLFLRFNRAASHGHLRAFAAVGEVLPSLRKSAAVLGETAVLRRCGWLEAALAADTGHWGHALPLYKKAIGAALGQQAFWEAGMIFLELASGLSAQGKTSEAADLAVCLDPILDAASLSPEALAALRRFHTEAGHTSIPRGLAAETLALFRRAPKTGPLPAHLAALPELAAFAAAGAALGATAGGRCGGAMAATTGVEEAAAVRCLGGRRGAAPQVGQPLHQAAHQAGGLGAGGNAPRQGG
ncbi:MAG TPA: hypothetical protein DD490_08175, partial [Acidobacteria bacterium]|nr:hypothetical protein [Acidobacteriota bacterium]